MKISPIIKKTLIIYSCILLLMILGNIIFNYQKTLELIIYISLIVSVVSSMVIIRFTKPGQRIKHREKIERIMSIAILIIMPLTLFIEFLSNKFQFLSVLGRDISITVPVIFILLATSKLLDDLIRLSLFKTDNSIKQQNVLNFNLTQRESEVADLLIKGYSYTKIGDTLFISIPTVKTHVSNIYKKVKVNNKMELLNTISN